jgi:hypothetical protein
VKLIFSVATLAVLAVLLSMSGDGGTTSSPDTGAMLLIILATILAIVAVIVGVLFIKKKGAPTINMTSGSFGMQALTGILLLLLLDYVLYQMNPSSPLFNTPEGYGHLALYFVLILVAGMVGAHYSGFKFAAGMLIVIFLFSAVGMRTKQLYDPDGRVWAKLTHDKNGSSPQAGRVVTQQCWGTPPEAPMRLTPESKLINPDGCDSVYAVVKGTVVLSGPTGSIMVSATTNVVGRRDYSIYKNARAEGPEALMYYMVCPKGKGPEDGSWKCRS